ncbi:response regulator transcription factor [Pseudotenacibaculum haliotis]|uniref:Response regulator transcription factor n=1 Tax=Pseudotenacibaculum haliotis TaxID=1862138 RepID=A0ABW5LST8_9FLAO
MPKNTISLLIVILILPFSKSYGQYLISGHIDGKEKNATVYLSLLRYDEESLISDSQVLFSTKTDSLGYFRFQGQLLSQKDKIYRIHTNASDTNGLQLVSDIDKSNYHNFIFSNTDTIFFKKTKDHWFIRSKNTNTSDTEWRKLKLFEEQLVSEYTNTKNKEAKRQTVNDFSEKLKSYSKDSIESSLVRLLAFSRIKTNNFDLKTDFDNNPQFYDNLLESLKADYTQKSYYLQYKDELSKITNEIVLQKYKRHRALNYVLGFLVLLLAFLSLLLFKRLKVALPKNIKSKDLNSTLTNQEEKIAKLICDNHTNKEIAQILFISLSTVKTHVRNLYGKFNVTNRKEFIEKFKNQP